jgi:hypothetical protein
MFQILFQGDFHHIPASDNSFDAAYACEAIEHAPEKVNCFSSLTFLISLTPSLIPGQSISRNISRFEARRYFRNV